MSKQMKECRVCGKTYESCRSVKVGSGVFNWREMCCSPECGQIYFQRVQEARNPAPKVPERKRHVRREEPVVEVPAPVSEAPDPVEEAPAEQSTEAAEE